MRRAIKSKPAARRIRESHIPTSSGLLKKLLTQKWAHLHREYAKAEGGSYPGVYILAYSKEPLEDKPVRVREIYYVGMSHAGVSKRLGRFVAGLEANKYHSAARRFFRTVARGVPFTRFKNRKTFYFASISVPCVVEKRLRTPADLRKMGEVAKCEFIVLAHVHEILGHEPELNLK